MNYVIAKRKEEDGSIGYLKLEEGSVLNKYRLMLNIKAGWVYHTKLPDGRIGDRIHIYNDEYLRTDRNEIDEDNLEEIPDF